MIRIENTKMTVFKTTAIMSRYSKNGLFFVYDANFHSPITCNKIGVKKLLVERLL